MSQFKGGRQFKFVAGKPSNREIKRQAARAVEMGFRAHSMLITVLMQRGGSITIAKGTIDQVNEKISALGWKAEESKENPGELIVSIVEGTAPVEGGRLE